MISGFSQNGSPEYSCYWQDQIDMDTGFWNSRKCILLHLDCSYSVVILLYSWTPMEGLFHKFRSDFPFLSWNTKGCQFRALKYKKNKLKLNIQRHTVVLCALTSGRRHYVIYVSPWEGFCSTSKVGRTQLSSQWRSHSWTILKQNNWLLFLSRWSKMSCKDISRASTQYITAISILPKLFLHF